MRVLLSVGSPLNPLRCVRGSFFFLGAPQKHHLSNRAVSEFGAPLQPRLLQSTPANPPVQPGEDPMSEGSSTSHWTLPPSQAVRVDQVCNAFEMAWKTSASSGSQRPQIEAFLEGFTSPEREVLLLELILLDRSYRTRAGERPILKEYQARFPAIASDIPEIFRQAES